MTFQETLTNLLDALPQEEKERLLTLANQDEGLLKETLLETLRLSVIAKTGNTRAWGKWQNEHEENLKFFLQELEDESNIALVKKQLREM